MIKKTEIPEIISLIFSFVFIGLTIPELFIWKPKDIGIIFMPFYFGLFMFLLCLCCVNLRKNDELKERIKNLEKQKTDVVS